MRCLKSAAIGLAVFAGSTTGANARAEGTVPGGWAAQVDYQSFQLPSYNKGFGSMHSAGGGFGFDSRMPYGSAFSQPGMSPLLSPQNVAPQVGYGLVPLGDVVRRSVRVRGRR
jgi:hypothetical protein